MLQRLKTDLVQAMKEKDKIKKATLQLAITAINNEVINKRKELNEDEQLALVQRELKQAEETLEFARKDGRAELITDAEYTVSILKSYLPEQLSEEELVELVKTVAAELGITSVKSKGLLMKEVLNRVKGRANGKIVNDIVSRVLAD